MSREVGRLVSVAQAAQLAHKSERAVRYRIRSGALPTRRGEDGHMRIDTEALARVPGWRVDEALLGRLDQIDQPTETVRLALTVAALEARMRALERRLARLERQMTQPVEPSETDRQLVEMNEPTVNTLETVERGTRTVTLADRGAGQVLTFATAAAAARWLVRHGVHSEYTPRSWPGWPPRPLTREHALALAQALLTEARVRGNWRVTWRLRRCGDPLCVCQTQLESVEEESSYEDFYPEG